MLKIIHIDTSTIQLLIIEEGKRILWKKNKHFIYYEMPINKSLPAEKTWNTKRDSYLQGIPCLPTGRHEHINKN